jgi:hypothetical protein
LDLYDLCQHYYVWSGKFVQQATLVEIVNWPSRNQELISERSTHTGVVMFVTFEKIRHLGFSSLSLPIPPPRTSHASLSLSSGLVHISQAMMFSLVSLSLSRTLNPPLHPKSSLVPRVG